MKLYIGSDHAGFYLKEKLLHFLASLDHTVVDCGADSVDSSDYPDYAKIVAQHVIADPGSRGILICGSGAGMVISANKINGIRAALCYNKQTAKASREHNDANILCLGARVSTSEDIYSVVSVWLETSFSLLERHKRRIEKLHALEN